VLSGMVEYCERHGFGSVSDVTAALCLP